MKILERKKNAFKNIYLYLFIPESLIEASQYNKKGFKVKLQKSKKASTDMVTKTEADLEVLHNNTEESVLFYKRKQCIY